MGVAISELIPKKDISLTDLKGKKLAIDSSNVIYQFLASIRQQDGTPLMDEEGEVTSHLMGLSTRIPKLMEQNIKLAFVFDGKPPKLKFQESQIRKKRKEEAEKKLKIAEKEGDTESISKYKKQTIKLDKKIVEESKEFIKALGLPVIQAPSEAEAQCAFMAEKKDVFACVSQDYDSLLYNTPRMIKNITVSPKKRIRGIYVSIYPEMIELEDVLKKLKINQDQLLALSILVGTDFNPKGVKRIGPKTALKLVQEHKSFEKIFANVEADFNWKEVYATFKNIPLIKNYQLKWKEPDLDKIQKILLKRDFSEQRIEKIFERLKPKKQKQLDKWF
jgi:flap endonuclease-1